MNVVIVDHVDDSNESTDFKSLANNHYQWMASKLGMKAASASVDRRALSRDRAALSARSVRRSRRGSRADLAASFDAERSSSSQSQNPRTGQVRDSNSRWARRRDRKARRPKGRQSANLRSRPRKVAESIRQRRDFFQRYMQETNNSNENRRA